jgi:hypothetical protein
MPAYTSTVIGHIVDVQGSQLTATLIEDEQGQVPTVTIGDEDITVGQIGSYVAIRQNEVHIIAIVTRMTEQEALAARRLYRTAALCQTDCSTYTDRVDTV